MYESHFSLEKNPFSMTADPGCLFMTEQHREAIAGLVYAIRSRKGLLVLTGEVGTGKTTVLSRVVRHLPRSSVQVAVILHPTLTPDEFIEMVMLDLGITDIPASKALRLLKLQKFLMDCAAESKTAALIVDEAHKLSPEVLEEIRLLGNLEAANHKLLQVVLVGQSELDGILRREEMRQLKQRVALRVSLTGLRRSEVHDYMSYRWSQAGGQQPIPFTVEAVSQVIHWSNGIPRLINSLCDQALLAAFGNGAMTVEGSYVQEAARDLDLAAPAPGRVMASPARPMASPKVTPMPGARSGEAVAAVPERGVAAAAVAGKAPAPKPAVPVVAAAAPGTQQGAPVIGGIRVPEFGNYARPKKSLLRRMAVVLGFTIR
jgi:general secretion pathway protein A